MEREKILEEVRNIVVATVPDLKGTKITSESTFGTLGLDSIKLVEIGVRIEQAFGAKIVLDNWVTQESARGENSFSMGSLVEFIQKSGTGN